MLYKGEVHRLCAVASKAVPYQTEGQAAEASRGPGRSKSGGLCHRQWNNRTGRGGLLPKASWCQVPSMLCPGFMDIRGGWEEAVNEAHRAGWLPWKGEMGKRARGHGMGLAAPRLLL